MKRSHSRRDEDESEERYRKRKDDKCDDDHKESKHNGDHRSSTSYSHHDDYKSSGRVDEYWNPRRDDHRDRRYSDEREAPKDSDVEASGKRNSPREKIGSRFYYESEKPRKNPLDAKQKRTLNLLRKWIPRIQSGPYIPPAKLRTLQTEHFTDKSGAAYQRIAWEALKKFIHGCMNKVNTSNIGIISRQLLRKNLVRGRGMLAGSILQAQAASPTFTPVYAALTSIINSKFPNIGELVLKRLVVQFKRGFKWHDNPLCIGAATFIAHLVNQHVAHEIIALEILTLLLETPTDDSVEVAIAFLKECGMKLTEVSPRGVEATFEMLRNILTEGQLDKPVQDMTVMFQIKKNGFKDHEAVPEELDLVKEEDQITHLISLDDKMDVNIRAVSNVFFFDPDYLASEERYKQLRKEILGSDFSDSDSSDSDASDSESDDEDGEEEVAIIKVENTRDNDAKANLAALRRTINLTINSSRNFEECAREVMKMHLKPGQETELCQMILDCCAEMRKYEKFFGRLAGQFCSINKMYVTIFEKIFRDSYTTIHRLDCNKLRNVAKFFGYLLFTDSISWSVLSFIQQNEKNASSSNRIFVKILFQELCEYMGLGKLKERIEDVDGQFPIDDPKNMQFVINFFTSIRRLYVGLGGLTNDCKLKKHLKSHPKPAAVIDLTVKEDESSSSDDDDESSLTSIDSSSSCPSKDEDPAKKKKMQPKRKEEKSKSKKEDKSSRSVDDESSLSLIDSSSSWSSEDEDLAKKKKVQHKRKEEKSKSKKEDKEEEKSKKAQSKKENGKHKRKEEKSKSKKEDKEEEKSKKARSKKERGKTLYARIKRPIHVRARFACMGRGRFLDR